MELLRRPDFGVFGVDGDFDAFNDLDGRPDLDVLGVVDVRIVPIDGTDILPMLDIVNDD